MNSLSLLLGGIYFAFQIYGDFSGYSDIAIGTSRLFGIDLMRNFKYPYFSRDIAEFWRRWHISLSTWFRDYLYIPLGGSKGNKWFSIRNVFAIFLVSGFWHGANWTFVFWGFINALYFIPLLLTNRNRKHSILDAFLYIKRMFSFNLNGGFMQYLSIERYTPELMLLIVTFVITEWFIKKYEHPFFGKLKSIKLGFIVLGIIVLGNFSNVNDFIYFQF